MTYRVVGLCLAVLGTLGCGSTPAGKAKKPTATHVAPHHLLTYSGLSRDYERIEARVYETPSLSQVVIVGVSRQGEDSTLWQSSFPRRGTFEGPHVDVVSWYPLGAYAYVRFRDPVPGKPHQAPSFLIDFKNRRATDLGNLARAQLKDPDIYARSLILSLPYWTDTGWLAFDAVDPDFGTQRHFYCRMTDLKIADDDTLTNAGWDLSETSPELDIQLAWPQAYRPKDRERIEWSIDVTPDQKYGLVYVGDEYSCAITRFRKDGHRWTVVDHHTWPNISWYQFQPDGTLVHFEFLASFVRWSVLGVDGRKKVGMLLAPGFDYDFSAERDGTLEIETGLGQYVLTISGTESRLTPQSLHELPLLDDNQRQPDAFLPSGLSAADIESLRTHLEPLKRSYEERTGENARHPAVVWVRTFIEEVMGRLSRPDEVQRLKEDLTLPASNRAAETFLEFFKRKAAKEQER